MPEPFKNFFNKKLVSDIADALTEVYPKFDKKKLMKLVFDKNWEGRELKDRMRHISISLNTAFGLPYKESLKVLRKAADNFTGFASIIFSDYVEVFGIDEYKESVRALAQFTQKASSEFAVRPFIIKYPDKMMKQMLKWSKHSNHHVRRLASEGCRPRLPWAMAIPEFKKDPSPILPVLENLKNDVSEYVRKSVANNLNDISKDNPELVMEIARKWLGKREETDRIMKHACRTLLKKGDAKALALFNVAKDIKVDIKNFRIDKNKIKIGGKNSFYFEIKLKEKKPMKIRLEYRVDYVNAAGKFSKKTFKISEVEMQPGDIKKVERNQNFKDNSIRKHRPGTHRIAVIINGSEKVNGTFELA